MSKKQRLLVGHNHDGVVGEVLGQDLGTEQTRSMITLKTKLCTRGTSLPTQNW